MPADDIRLVIFDLGRVLIRIVDNWQQAYQRAGLPVDQMKRTGDFIGSISRVFEDHQVGQMSTGDFLEQFAALDGLSLDQADAVMTAWLCGPYDDAMTLIDELIDRDIRTACLSNTNAHHWALMTAPSGPNALGLDRLDHLFASHLMRLAKPDEAIYRKVEREVDLSSGSILFFDDAPENVEAARRCGWRAEIIEHDGDPASQMRRSLRTYGVLT